MWEGFGSADTWEPLCDVILPKGTVNPILKDYLTHNSMMEVAYLAMKQAERKSKRGSED